MNEWCNCNPSCGGDEQSISRALAARIAADDRDAEACAYRRYNDGMRQCAWKFSGCKADVDDWVSIAWLRALPKLRDNELLRRESLGPFLYAMTRYVALGELRKCKWLKTTDDSAFLEQTAIDEDTPYNAVSRQQQLQRTAQLIRLLPVPRDSELIQLSFVDECERATLCEKYGVSKLQLSRWISRARKRLRAAAAGELDSILCA